MRRKRLRRKSWLARLFSPKARAAAKAAKAPKPTGQPEPRSVEAPARPGTAKAAATTAEKRGKADANLKTSGTPVPKPGPKRMQPLGQKPHGAAVAPSEMDGESPAGLPLEDGNEGVLSRVDGWLGSYARKVGMGSLMVSLFIHLTFLIAGSFIVTSVAGRKMPVDFLAGGGSKAGHEASEQLAAQLRQKRHNVFSKPAELRKLAVNNSSSAIALPDLATDTMNLPDLTNPLGGTMGSGGFGKTGAGGGFGKGMGMGGLSGRSPITMFGHNLNARSIAVILDVSGSMTPHLSKVILELDRVAKGSPVVLYVGCGIDRPPSGVRLDDSSSETRRSPRFRDYWQENHGPEEDVYNIMKTRPFTYYIKNQGIQYAWIALLTDEVRHAEALYWFSDFQDDVNEQQMATVLENLKRRRQKLFIHASDEGNSFETIRDKLCVPSGGAIIRSR